jgi:methyl-accepting chemotaxis protein
MKLRVRIVLFGVLPALLLLVVVAGIVLQSMYANLRRLGEMRLRENLHELALQIEDANLQAVNTARMMALTQENGMFGKRQESIDLARAVLETHPTFTGAYFGYEPDADGGDAATLAAVRAGGDGDAGPRAFDAGGRFLPYWFRDHTDPSQIRLTPLVDMEKSYYYRGMENRVLGRPEAEGIKLEGGISTLYRAQDLAGMRFIITEPYTYEGKLIVEQTAPIMIDDRFVGIAGVDRALQDIDASLMNQVSYETEGLVLLSRRGRIISATARPELRTKRLEDTPYGTLLHDLYVGETGELLEVTDDPIGGERRYYAGTRVPTGDWTVVLTVAESELLAPVWRTLRNATFLLIAGGLLATLSAFFFVRPFASRVEEAALAAERVADGDLTVNVASTARDETGKLIGSIGGMVRSLGDLVGQVKRSSVQLVSAATEIGSATRQQEDMTHDFGASTSQIAASVKEISATSQELLRTMNDVTAATNETAEVADRGRSGLGGMEATMRGLAEATSAISAKLAIISERANNIGKVVTTITKVADQTNLLSLNAAIEAEKAGEYGHGFAVVAREIRRLADQTAVATLDIEQIVGEMQSSVTSGVMEMDRFTEEVRRGVGETGRIGSELAHIIERVETLTPRFRAVHEGMAAQAAGAEQINEAMRQLTEVARHSAESTESLHAASAQLHAAVEGLKSEVARFRVG